MTGAEFFRRISLSGHPLCPRIVEFNARPSRTLHESWLSRVPHAEVFRSLGASPRAEARFSRHILASLGGEDGFFLDFEPASRRMALLDGPGLLALVRYAGLALNGREIGRIIGREAVAAVKREIGEAQYLFALKKGPFLAGGFREERPEPEGPGGLPGRLDASGLSALRAVFSGEPAPLARRLSWKLPVEWSPGFSESPARDKDALAGLMQRILIQEVAPSWAPLFG